jgi:hypothetical protein
MKGEAVPERKQLHVNLFEMNCVGHISHGLWVHPDNTASTYRTSPAPHTQGNFGPFRLLLRHAEVKPLIFTDRVASRSWNQ